MYEQNEGLNLYFYKLCCQAIEYPICIANKEFIEPKTYGFIYLSTSLLLLETSKDAFGACMPDVDEP